MCEVAGKEAMVLADDNEAQSECEAHSGGIGFVTALSVAI